MSNEIDQYRRRLVRAAAMTFVASPFAFTAAEAQLSRPKPANLGTVKPGTHTSFAPLKQIDAGVLSVGYEAGPAEGPSVILMRGWPYDIYAFVDVAPSAWRTREDRAPRSPRLGASIPVRVRADHLASLQADTRARELIDERQAAPSGCR